MKNVRKTVFFPSVVIMAGMVLSYMISEKIFDSVFTQIGNFIVEKFAALFLSVALLSVIVCTVVFFTGASREKIGGEDAKPMLSTFNWFCITLCTTIAVGIIFWSVAEPIYYIASPPAFLNIADNETAKGTFALSTMFFHWTITPYAIYCVPALMFAIAIYNLKRPFSFTSVIASPEIWKNSNFVDALCTFTTVIGIVASLGQGILTLAGGLENYLKIPSNAGTWWALGTVITIIVVISACSGLLKGIKFLSKLNTYLLLGLLLFLFVLGPTTYMINLSLESLGIYINTFFSKSLTLGTASGSNFSYYWTISSFANWMAWAPSVALFLGKIAYGHSVRKFIAVNLIAPSVFSMIWLGVFSSTSIYMNNHVVDLYQMIEKQGIESLLYAIFEKIPLAGVSIPLLIVCVFISFVTASDSTIHALADLSLSNQGGKSSAAVKIVFGCLIGASAVIILMNNGVGAIKMLSTIGGLPACLLILAANISLIRYFLGKRKK